jgi:DNA primase
MQKRGDSKRMTPVRKAIHLLLHYPIAAASVDAPAELARINQRGMPLLIELLELCKNSHEPTAAFVEERFRERPEAPHLHALLAQEMLLDKKQAIRELQDTLTGLVKNAVREQQKALLNKEQAAPGSLTQDEKQRLLRLQNILAN